MTLLLVLFISIVPLAVIAAGLKDVVSMTIPNWLNASLAIGFLPTALVLGMPLGDIAMHFGVGLAALFVGIGLFALRLFGGGDAKLVAAVALWMGTSAVLPFVLWTAIAGGSLSLLLLSARSQLQFLAPVCPGWISTLLAPKGDIPYGVAIAIGALAAYPTSQIITLFAERL